MPTENITDTTMQDTITEALILWNEAAEVRTFEEAGVMTYNKGLVVRLWDGSEFQVTIVQSR